MLSNKAPKKKSVFPHMLASHVFPLHTQGTDFSGQLYTLQLHLVFKTAVSTKSTAVKQWLL